MEWPSATDLRWEQDHTLRTAIRDSVVWYFQEVARRIGNTRMSTYLTSMHYGNERTEPAIDTFWLTSDGLRITPSQQVDLLAKLYSDQLPFETKHMALVRELIVLGTRHEWTLSDKTGSSEAQRDGLTIGWWSVTCSAATNNTSSPRSCARRRRHSEGRRARSARGFSRTWVCGAWVNRRGSERSFTQLPRFVSMRRPSSRDFLPSSP